MKYIPSLLSQKQVSHKYVKTNECKRLNSQKYLKNMYFPTQGSFMMVTCKNAFKSGIK